MPDHPEEPRDNELRAESPVPDSKKARSPYDQLPFDLKQEELTQTGTQKMLLGDVTRLNQAVGELREYERKFHESDKKLGVLQSQFQQYTALEILYTMGVAAAFAVFGWLVTLPQWSARHYVALACAFVFAGVAVWGKWMGVRHED